jgi:hypothetical protein
MKTGRAAENRHFSVNGITEFNRHIAVRADLIDFNGIRMYG